jgi:hypothetical protein
MREHLPDPPRQSFGATAGFQRSGLAGCASVRAAVRGILISPADMEPAAYRACGGLVFPEASIAWGRLLPLGDSVDQGILVNPYRSAHDQCSEVFGSRESFPDPGRKPKRTSASSRTSSGSKIHPGQPTSPRRWAWQPYTKSLQGGLLHDRSAHHFHGFQPPLP